MSMIVAIGLHVTGNDNNNAEPMLNPDLDFKKAQDILKKFTDARAVISSSQTSNKKTQDRDNKEITTEINQIDTGLSGKSMSLEEEAQWIQSVYLNKK